MLVSNEDIIKKCGIELQILTAGIQLNDFVDNPVLLKDHEPEDVLGKWEDIQLIGSELHMNPIFDEEDEDALKVKRKMEKGLIKGASVGLTILDYMKDENGVIVVTNSLLNEVSVTALPANKATLKLKYNNKELKMSNTSKKEFELFLSEDKIDEILELKNDNTLELSQKIESLNMQLGEKDEVILSLSQKVDGLIEKLKAVEEKERIDFIELSIKEGKFNETQRQSLINLSNLNFDMVKELILNTISHNVPEVNVNEMIKKEVNLSDRSEWTLGDYIKKDYEGLSNMKLNNSELYNKLYKEYYKK